MHAQFIGDAKRLLTQYLEENNLRRTPERYAILEEVYNISGHFDVELLYKRMQKSQQPVSRATLQLSGTSQSLQTDYEAPIHASNHTLRSCLRIQAASSSHLLRLQKNYRIL